MSGFVPIFGDQLIDKDGSMLNTAEYLEGKVVLAYSSAHWCPPCRRMTPKLAGIVPELAKSKPVAFVFVSSDRDQETFDDYRKEMPGPAIPFEKRDIEAKFSAKYGVNGIPNLVILDTDGSTITKKGLEAVLSDTNGDSFPWKPLSPQEVISKSKLVNASGEEVPFSSLEGKHIGLYFSASWCGPCRSFSPKLIEAYNNLKKAGKEFEIIFVSSDRDEASFKEYFGHMPWLAVDLADKGAKQSLSSAFDVEGIPTFVMLDDKWEVVNGNARGSVTSDPKGANFPWAPPAVPDINEDDVGEELNGREFVVLMAEYADDADQDEALAALNAIVGSERPKEGTLYGIAKSEGGISKQIRSLCKLSQSEDIQAVFLKLPSRKYHTGTLADANEEAVRKFVQDCESGAISAESLE